MLENTNDYMSVLSIIIVLFAFLYLLFHAISQKAVVRHLREEADYYSGKKKQR